MASEKDRFDLSGPSYLTDIDWSNLHHRRSNIAASLVKGVSVLEKDRQANRQDSQALAPPWWQHFNFKLNRLLIDDNDHSYFGAIYESNTKQRPPEYVIAFRGTISGQCSIAQDLKLILNCIINILQHRKRFKTGFELTKNLISQVESASVWLAGHSLGSYIALLIGRHMVQKTGVHLETYLFNPPFISVPIEMIPGKNVKFVLRILKSVIAAGLTAAKLGGSPPFISAPIETIPDEKVKLVLRILKIVIAAGLAAARHGDSHSEDQESNDPFTVLSKWIPYLFINQSDPICSEYVGYFKNREKMEKIGMERLAATSSIGNIFTSTLGIDSEAAHLIPSAYLSINSSPCNGFKKAHGINQWWKIDLELKDKLYQYK